MVRDGGGALRLPAGEAAACGPASAAAAWWSVAQGAAADGSDAGRHGRQGGLRWRWGGRGHRGRGGTGGAGGRGWLSTVAVAAAADVEVGDEPAEGSVELIAPCDHERPRRRPPGRAEADEEPLVRLLQRRGELEAVVRASRRPHDGRDPLRCRSARMQAPRTVPRGRRAGRDGAAAGRALRVHLGRRDAPVDDDRHLGLVRLHALRRRVRRRPCARAVSRPARSCAPPASSASIPFRALPCANGASSNSQDGLNAAASRSASSGDSPDASNPASGCLPDDPERLPCAGVVIEKRSFHGLRARGGSRRGRVDFNEKGSTRALM